MTEAPREPAAPPPETPARGGPPQPVEEEQPRKGAGASPNDPEGWMVTFSDMLTLMMTFFVLIFASQDPIKEKIQEAFGQDPGVFGRLRTSVVSQVRAVPRQDISQDRLQVFLNQIGSIDIAVSQEERGLVVTLPADTFFAASSAQLDPRAIKRLGLLGEYLALSPHRIGIDGHTDNEERGAPRYRDAWELSLARAHAVLLFFAARGIAERRLSIAGYGPSHPRFDNAARAGRERNRRVEVVIFNRGQRP